MLNPVLTLAIFQKQPDPQVFSAGQLIFEEGQPGNYMYGIVEGTVDLFINGKVVETIETGGLFGTGVLIGVYKRSYTAIAKTDCQLAYIDEKRFLFAVQETPMFALNVMRSYAERLSRLQRLV